MFQGILLSIILMICHEGYTYLIIEGVPSSFSEDLCLPQPVCNGTSSGSYLRCRCDDLCSVYDECCPDAPSLGKELPFETSVTPDDWSCITPIINKCGHQIHMVTSCPKTADLRLASKCAQEQHSSEDYDFLKDIPVKSSVTGFVYRNIFCAQCHTDAQYLENVTLDLICSRSESKLASFGILTKMNYIPGNLEWRGILTEGMGNTYFHNFSKKDIGDAFMCEIYYEISGRICFYIKRKCSEFWPDDITRKRCSSHSYRVVAQKVVYKNYYCAICNNASSKDIACKITENIVCGWRTPTLTDIFKFTGDCEETEHWNFLSQECEPITWNYSRNFTTSLSNGSIYINSTGKLYRKGEYEAGEDQIQVHQEQTATTASVLQLVSTVSICISLVCMILHLFLVLSQPERSSASSLSHVCMVCSLFLAELVFLLAFGGLENRHLCMACALLMDFFFTASFLWMGVISFDMCRAFRSRTFRRRSLKTFATYLGMVAVPSLLKTLTVALVDNLSTPDFFMRPNFGMNRCWYNKMWSLSFFFLGPVFVVVATNLLVYIFFVYDLFRQQKAAEFAGASGFQNRKLREGKKPKETKTKDVQMEPPSETKEEEADSPPGRSEQEKHRLFSTYRTQLGIYTKVGLLMGISWVLPLIGAFKQSIVLDYSSVILNGLQGAFIFLAFDCKLNKWRNAFRRKQIKRGNQ